jgi:membrane protein DedA with SNARE-associated domain
MKAIFNALLAWGPLGAFVAAIIDGAGLPSPGGMDWLLILLCVNRPRMAWWMAGLTILGSIIGCFILYAIARRAGDKMLEKYRHQPKFQRFERWFQRYGLLTVFIPALVPIPLPMKFFVICAGVFEVPAAVFVSVMLAARIPRFLGLAYLGVKLGEESWPWVKSHALHMAGSAVLLFAFLYVLILIADKRRRRLGLE